MKISALLRRCARALLLLAGALVAFSAPAEIKPVTPDAAPEAVALLQFLHEISGRYTLTGQHNYPNTKSRNSEFAAKYLGHPPVIWGTDFGHAKAGDTDSYLARPDIVQEAIKQHRAGAIVAICWHAVPPTTDEPGTFRPLPGADPKKLASVQGKLLDEQFKDVLTPGTALHEHWAQQVDAIAVFLKQLQDAHVPVLWRPYHEMNGDWFWWGGRGADTAALYRQIFDRLVHHHHLKNLVWVWSVDRESKPGMEHAKVFPGLDTVDVLALDVYGNDFAQSYYDSLVALSGGKPLALAEVGNPPAPDVLKRQPLWTFYMTWAGMVRNTSRRHYETLFADSRILNLDDPAYALATTSYRDACALPRLSPLPKPRDFSGRWILDDEKSDFGQAGAGFVPSALEIDRSENRLILKSTRVSEFSDDQITEEAIPLDGSETKSEFMNSPRLTTAHLAADSHLEMKSVISPVWAPGTTFTTTDLWTVADDAASLTIHRTSQTPRGEQKQILVYRRR